MRTGLGAGRLLVEQAQDLPGIGRLSGGPGRAPAGQTGDHGLQIPDGALGLLEVRIALRGLHRLRMENPEPLDIPGHGLLFLGEPHHHQMLHLDYGQCSTSSEPFI